MKKTILLSLVLQIVMTGCASFKPTLLEEKSHLVENCRIYSTEGELIRQMFSGVGVCSYKDNGSFLYGNYKNELTFYDKNNLPLWKKNLPAHHQINQTVNGDFLIISNEVTEIEGKKVRTDAFLRISPDGNIVGNHTLTEDTLNLFGRKLLKLRKLTQPESEISSASFELTHANSIYEIPDNKLSQKYPEFAKGNIIVNLIYFNLPASPYGEFLIFDSQLRNIVKRIPAPVAKIHDVQVNEKGEIVLYNNYTNWKGVGQKNFRMHSSLEKYSYPEMNLTWKYGDLSQENYFYSHICGGVQFINEDLILFSDQTGHAANATFIDSDGNVLKKLRIKEMSSKIDMSLITGFQQMKLINLSEFLMNNKSL